MSHNGEMEAMLATAPAGPGEPLVSVLCVEATASAQAALEEVVAQAASSAAALRALRKLHGTRLRVSPYTTVHVLRSFLMSQEAARTAAASGDSLARAQFFAVRVPAAAAAAATAEARAGDGDTVVEIGAEAEETLVVLHDSTTLHEVLGCDGVLQLPAELSSSAGAAAAESETTLVLLYTRERVYGDMIDACIFGFCAAIGGWIASMCIRETVKTVNEQKQARKEKKARKEQEQQQQQQQQQQQSYYQSQPQPPPQQQQWPNGGPSPLPPPGVQQGGYLQGMPPFQQPYYQGPASPNLCGAPPQPQLQQQQPVNGYPVNQPSTYTYYPSPPPARTAEASASPLAEGSSPHGLPPPQYPSSINEDHKSDEDDPVKKKKEEGGLTFKADPDRANEVPTLGSPTERNTPPPAVRIENPSCPSTKAAAADDHASSGGGGSAAATQRMETQPQYGSLKVNDDAPGWSWSPINTAGEEAIWSPASGQGDAPKKP